MNRLTLIIMTILYILSIVFLVVSIIIYKINQSKMDEIIESYIGKGLYLSAGVKLGRFLGVYGQFQVAMFFYQLLIGKRMRINEKDSKYMYKESYDFIRQLPRNMTSWLKTYILTTFISILSFSIGMIFVLYFKYT
ncbi:hypothetical protein CE143_13055 [Photorhabdus luminescens]|uniref:DUF3899 domain-containing protein n=1 Tax=Photorhabdus akhurstii TaxID=171438 RepID=A0ABX8LUK0_9GAMM|nr:hypothetical protein [Photorhabdus akhurstii]QXF33971.1 hypothetical protein B0X70_13055 [Photorhabdus akhurstii]UJD75787.1 hypothetical protein CE143_13055 [Photorhabdus luminescens]